MTRIVTYQTVTGQTLRYRARKPGPKPLPGDVLRSRRVTASVTSKVRDRLDAELALLPFSESDIVEMALLDWFARMNQERILYGLLHSNPFNS